MKFHMNFLQVFPCPTQKNNPDTARLPRFLCCEMRGGLRGKEGRKGGR